MNNHKFDFIGENWSFSIDPDLINRDNSACNMVAFQNFSEDVFVDGFMVDSLYRIFIKELHDWSVRELNRIEVIDEEDL